MKEEKAPCQSTSDAEWDRIKGNFSPNPEPRPEPPSRESCVVPAMEEAREKRNEALSNARIALEEAFDKKYHEMIKSKTAEERQAIGNVIQQKATPIMEEVTETNIDELVKELESEFSDGTVQLVEVTDGSKDKRLEETKELIKNFKEKVAKYPKHLSYEGSMVLCVMLSMKEPSHPSLNNLPLVDQQLIRALVPSKFLGDLDYFSVTFDDNKDFNMKFSCRSESEPYLMTMFNSVAHPRPEDLKDIGAGVVPVEKDGDKIAVGGKILLNKKGIKRLIGVEPLKRNTIPRKEDDDEVGPKRIPVAGRNAYEIRADVLQMAIDWAAKQENQTEEDVLDLAKKFYQFVENKR